MKVILLTLTYLLVTTIRNCDADCEFRVANFTYKPLVFERHGSNYRFLNIKEGSLYVPRKNFVMATCQHSGFKFSSHYTVSSVKLFCSKNGNRYISYDKHVRKYDPEVHELGCNSAVIQHYASQVRGCAKQGVVAAYANMLKDYYTTDLVKVAEFCYDPDNRRTQFVHYIGATRSPYVELQYKYNVGLPSENDKDIAQGKLKPLPFYELQERLANLTAVELSLQKYLEIKHDKAITFKHGYLLDQFLLPYQYKRVMSSDLNQIVVWDSLKRGNAKLLSYCLRDLSSQFDVDLYSGTSGTIEHHLYFNEKPFYGLHIPKFLWTMARVKYQNKVRGVVVVQLNNPYLTNEDISRQVFCEDICDSVPWLSPLSATRDVPSLGYTFCCSLADAVQSIPELPAHLVQRYGGKSTRPATQSTQTVSRTLLTTQTTPKTTLPPTTKLTSPTSSFTFSLRTLRTTRSQVWATTRRSTLRVTFPTRTRPTVTHTTTPPQTTRRSSVSQTTVKSTVKVTTTPSTTTKLLTTTKSSTTVKFTKDSSTTTEKSATTSKSTTPAQSTHTPVSRRMAKRSSNERRIQNEKIEEIMKTMGKEELTLVAKIVDRRPPD